MGTKGALSLWNCWNPNGLGIKGALSLWNSLSISWLDPAGGWSLPAAPAGEQLLSCFVLCRQAAALLVYLFLPLAVLLVPKWFGY